LLEQVAAAVVKFDIEHLLLFNSQSVKRPQRPSREDLNCEVSKVYEETNTLQARAEELLMLKRSLLLA
jgi:hypothetical protein